MFYRIVLIGLVAVMFGFCAAQQAIAQHRSIEMELIADERGQLGVQQEWMEALDSAGIDRVRIVTSQSGKRPAVEEVQLGESVLVRLTGTISGRRLLLPGREFAITDVENIAAWVRQLRDDGAAVTMAEKKGFGLTSEQLVNVHTDLSTVVAESTKGLPVGDVFDAIRSQLTTRFVLTPKIEALLRAGDETVQDELKGFSAGFSLAALVRPLGLVVVPSRPQGGEIQIQLMPADEASEHWPIGWPVEGEARKVAPGLFDRIDVDIQRFKLTDALNAISGRVGVPIVIDQNSLARKMVDPATTIVTLVQPKLTYYSIVIKLCSQTRPALSLQLRTDENGKPFFWVF